MSDRGCWMTEFIYCPKCRETVRGVLSGVLLEPIYTIAQGPDSGMGSLHGRVSGLYPGEEIDVFESEIIPALEGKVCHPVRFAVIAESVDAAKTFKIGPDV